MVTMMAMKCHEGHHQQVEEMEHHSVITKTLLSQNIPKNKTITCLAKDL